MKYEGIYACGHEGVVNIFGPTKDRQWKKEREFSKICPECYKKARQEELDEENRKAMEAAAEMELPVLIGSEKQVAWATTIRGGFIDKVSSMASFTDKKVQLGNAVIPVQEWAEVFDSLILKQTSAKFWIENRTDSAIWKAIADEYEAIQKDNEIPEEVKLEMEQAEQELIVAPENPEKSGVVKIKITDTHVESLYPKDSDFREIVKEKGFSWSGTLWELKKSSTSGDLIDRAAELGNELLANGFTVQFPDSKSKELAISGNFEPKCENWVLLNTTTGKLAIHWKGQNNSFYKKAKLLPSAKWSNGSMSVSVEFYREVEEFAEIMGFKLSKAALDAIEKYKEIEEGYERKIVKAVSAESVDYETRLKTVLEKEGVIEDLIDD